MNQIDRTISQKIGRLLECGPLKTWSVLVTIMGDLCTERGDQIDGRTLTVLTANMGITSQAVRVALHRLRRDGWIDSTKTGRSATHALTHAGWDQTQAVRQQIYSPCPRPDLDVFLAVAGPDMTASGINDLISQETLQIAPRTALVLNASDLHAPDVLFTRLSPATIPGWAAETVVSDRTLAEYQLLTESVGEVLKQTAPSQTIEQTVLRLLILHQWRRLRLRHGDLPDAILQKDWAGATARTLVARALGTFRRPSLEALRQLCQDIAI